LILLTLRQIAVLAEESFFVWDELVKEFTNVAREVTRKRSEKFIPIKINAMHSKLQSRVNYLRNFRRQHEQLHSTIIKVLKPEGVSSDEVGVAYDSLKSIDVLDVSYGRR
jgi:dynein heavy chain 1